MQPSGRTFQAAKTTWADGGGGVGETHCWGFGSRGLTGLSRLPVPAHGAAENAVQGCIQDVKPQGAEGG